MPSNPQDVQWLRGNGFLSRKSKEESLRHSCSDNVGSICHRQQLYEAVTWVCSCGCRRERTQRIRGQPGGQSLPFGRGITLQWTGWQELWLAVCLRRGKELTH